MTPFKTASTPKCERHHRGRTLFPFEFEVWITCWWCCRRSCCRLRLNEVQSVLMTNKMKTRNKNEKKSHEKYSNFGIVLGKLLSWKKIRGLIKSCVEGNVMGWYGLLLLHSFPFYSLQTNHDRVPSGSSRETQTLEAIRHDQT